MKRDEIIDEIYALSSFAVGNGDVCEIIARRLRSLAQKIEGEKTGDDVELEEKK